ncbi:alpha/beta fold hydrolase [Aquimarina sp. AU119]|uniref:alpha/beta fold hydrolase n=1 Tax=Aquimarina sp. AU119 TaxID=2108528 RepID=UPI000D69487F|nr:alpha/beta fold hydrolase [Aquimarina sp. AU119]
MNKKWWFSKSKGYQKRAIIIVLIMVLLGIISYDLSQLQAGLEKPSNEILLTVSKKSEHPSRYKSITSYDNFYVEVEDSISIQVYSRETTNAVGNVIMIHGAGGGAWAWEVYFECLPTKYNLYALSWRGHFGSTHVIDANTHDYVIDQKTVINTVMRRNSLPIHIIGHSYGGATSVMLEAQSENTIASLHLLTPVVPLNYSSIQKILVPVIAPFFINYSNGNNPSGTYGNMFISQRRMEYYHELYAGEEFSIEKPGLIAGDGISADWQIQLDKAYQAIGEKTMPVWMFIARYDNVVVPNRQYKTALAIGAEVIEFESGHYIQLDIEAEKSVAHIIANLDKLYSKL